MTAPAPDRAVPRLACVAVSTLAMAAALASVRFANTWLVTALAGALGIALALRVDSPILRRRLEPGMVPAALGLGVGIAMVGLTLVLWPPLAHALPALAQALVTAYQPLSDWPGARAALPVIALVVLAEELVWRGVLVEYVESRSSSPVRFALPAGVYASAQIATGSPLLVCVALLCGTVWTLLRLHSGSLLAPLLAHLVWALAVFVVWPLA